MERRRDDEVSRFPPGDLLLTETTDDISSLNEAWLHTLGEYAIDTPLSRVVLPMVRSCFFGGAIYAVLLLQKGHGDRLTADIAGFIAESRRVDPRSVPHRGSNLATRSEDEPGNLVEGLRAPIIGKPSRYCRRGHCAQHGPMRWRRKSLG